MLTIWFLLFSAILILFFILAITHKPFRKLSEMERAKTAITDLPWGLQRYGVGEEALTNFIGDQVRQSLFDEMLERMGRRPIEEEIINATLFGLEIGLQSDDYARAGIEFENPEFAAKQLEKIEFELFDTEIYNQHQFYAHAILVMQDMLGQQRPQNEKEVLQENLKKYREKLAELESRLKFQFKGMQFEEIGTRHDRELFYFKMGITNYLRGKDIVPELDQLYRVYGVNYQVENAFQMVIQSLPVFKKLIGAGIQQLAQKSLLEIENLIHQALKTSESPSRLNNSSQK